MAAEHGSVTTRPAVTPSLAPASLEDTGAFLRAAGLVFDEITGDQVTGHLDLSPDHHTPWGIVHGGVYAAIAETLASQGTAMGVRPEGRVPLGMSNLTSFLRPVSEGSVHGEATAIHRGRTTWVWDVQMRDDDGRLCATSRVTIAVRDEQPR